MITITEARLTFSFSDAWKVNKYDESKFFRNHVEKCQGSKAVEFILFLEQDKSPHPLKRFEISCSDLERAMRYQMKFLNVHCLVHNRETYAKKPLGWDVWG